VELSIVELKHKGWSPAWQWHRHRARPRGDVGLDWAAVAALARCVCLIEGRTRCAQRGEQTGSVLFVALF